MKDLRHKCFFKAFTLSEVLIALSIVGVVSAVTLPAFVSNVKDSIRLHSANIFSRKFSKSIELMRTADKLAPYSDTADFVNELQKYLKVTKICDFEHITDCWPYERIKLKDGSQYSVNQINIADELFKTEDSDPNGNRADFTQEIMALQIVDGTSVIIGYNTMCDPYDKPIENCYVALFEINGKSLPNQVGRDAILLNAKHFGGKISTSDDNDIECTGNVCSRGGD